MIDSAEITDSNGWRLYIYHTDGSSYNTTDGFNETAEIVEIGDDYVVIELESMGRRRYYYDEYANRIRTESV